MAEEPAGEGKKAPRRKDPIAGAKYRRASYVYTLALIAIFALAVTGLWDVAVSRAYPVRQAIEWNWRARATNNLLDMASYFNRSIALLEAYHGNPAWIFPTADTDFDQIRTNIIESRDPALAVATNVSIGSVGYQQAIQNLQETIVEINEHLALAKSWFVNTPAAVALAPAYVVLTTLGVVSIGLARMKEETRQGTGILFGLTWFVGSVTALVFLVIVP